MNKLEGFDVVIICCSGTKQADYWQLRLEKGKGSILPLNCTVLAVEEDWEGGAGNGKSFVWALLNALSFVLSFGYSLCIPKGC